MNGTFTLAQALQASATSAGGTGWRARAGRRFRQPDDAADLQRQPKSNDAVTMNFQQSIGRTEGAPYRRLQQDPDVHAVDDDSVTSSSHSPTSSAVRRARANGRVLGPVPGQVGSGGLLPVRGPHGSVVGACAPCVENAGQTAAEYMGVLLVVAAIIAALVTSDIGIAIAREVHRQICAIAGGDGLRHRPRRPCGRRSRPTRTGTATATSTTPRTAATSRASRSASTATGRPATPRPTPRTTTSAASTTTSWRTSAATPTTTTARR